MDIKILLVVAVALLVIFRDELFGSSSVPTFRAPAGDPFGAPVPAPNYAIAPPSPPRPPNAADVIISAIHTGGQVGIAAINRR